MQKYGRYILNKVHLVGGAILPSCVEHVSPPGLCTDVPTSLYHIPLHFTTSSVLSYCWNHRSDDDHCASDQASVLSLTLVRVEMRALHGNARSAHPKPAEVKGKPNQPLNHGLHGPGGLLALPLCREARLKDLTGVLPQSLCLGCLLHFGHHDQGDAFCSNGLEEEFRPYCYDTSARLYTSFFNL